MPVLFSEKWFRSATFCRRQKVCRNRGIRQEESRRSASDDCHKAKRDEHYSLAREASRAYVLKRK
jgi:hypothetical protein